MSKLKTAGLILGLLCLAALAWAVYLYSLAGEFKTIAPHFKGSCQALPGVVGGEDMALHPDGSLLYVSSDDRRAIMTGKPVPGAIFGLSASPEGHQPVNLTPRPPQGFHPHGIGLWAEPGKADRLFVVSHPGASLFGPNSQVPEGPLHTIEVFDRIGVSLKHIRTIADPALVSPNDVVPVGPNSFYVTNDHGTSSLGGQKFDDYLRLANSHVVYYDGSSFREVASDLLYANGINTSEDGLRVFVAATTGRELITYKRDVSSGSLDELSRTFLDTGPDNISRGPDGTLWVACHPQLLTFVAHAEDPGEPSPSQVLKLTPTEDDGFEVSEVFLSLGQDLSASAVAIRHGQRLLIGPVFDDHLLDCTMD